MDELINAFALVVDRAYGLALLEHATNPNGSGELRHINQAITALQLAGDLGIWEEVQLKLNKKAA